MPNDSSRGVSHTNRRYDMRLDSVCCLALISSEFDREGQGINA